MLIALSARPRAGGARSRHRRHRAGRLSGRRGARSAGPSPAARPTPASSSTAPASDRRSPRTRSAASGRSMATTETIARYSREHNGANVLTLGATLVTRRGGAGDRRHMADDADARAALHPAAGEDSRSGAAVVTRERAAAADRDCIVERAVGGRASRGRRARCACHSVLDDCCPDRLRGVLDAGATRVGVHASGGAPAGVASMIDHTLLKPDATRAGHRGAVPRGGAVQVRDRLRQPDLGRALPRGCLPGSGVGVCSVVGFPLGATTADVKGYETRRAIFDGAREIDMVINVGALKSGDLRVVERDIEAGHRRPAASAACSAR